jgi:hypothetical protein
MYKSEVRSDDSSVLREARTRGDSRVRQASRARNQRASLVDEQSGTGTIPAHEATDARYALAAEVFTPSA